MTHIIRQQHLHVEVIGTESDGLALQHSLPVLCRDWLIPAIERVLERLAPPDGHLTIERLDIDAGTMMLDRLEHDLAERVAQAIEKAFRGQLPPGDPTPTTVSGNITHKTEQQSIQDGFIYFLKTGSLPWSFRLPAGSALEQAIRDSWQAAAKSGAKPIAVNESVLRVLVSPTVRRRLIRQFSSDFLEKLISLLSPEIKKALDVILETLRTFDAPAVDIKHFERHLWETVYACVASGKILTSKDLVSEAWRALPVTTGDYIVLSSVLEGHWPGAISKAPARGKKIAEPRPTKRTGPMPPNTTDPISPTYTGVEKAPIDISEHPDIGEGIYVENAGLILLHPFLPQFFEALDIATEDKLLQSERALCLLHFLTTGQLIAPEYELVLPKILCNVPLGTTVAADVALTAVEQEEASALLQAVIRHWEALRNTSPDGLRGTFLIRPGKVTFRDDGDWLLQVESNTFDILLDQLPWGISMIKLPWMEKMLWVEWR